ncbi:MAG: protein kinase [Gemmatimonadota bacterium]|nr:protein kinase [Gemmatimonadota bacterium]
MTEPPGRLSAALADRYRLEREVGQGGMATVYLAFDLRHDRKVALKVLRPELAAVIGAERFLAEIKTTANLQHPHILALFDSGEVDGTVFYVMPYVEGESLRDRIAREHQLPVDDAVRLATQVAGALDYAHRHGVVHRDIKPENILLHDGSALVADFGIALAVSRSDGGSRMTETGMSLGTPHYMAPEQAMGEREITPKADVYALGCVLYEMLVGEPPFTGPTAQAIVARVMTEEPRSLTVQRRTIPPHVEAVVRQALEKLPADRFASAAELAAALGNSGFATGRAGVTAGAAHGRPLHGRPLPGRGAAVAIAVVAIILAAIGWLRPRPSTPTTWQYVTVGDTLRLPLTFPGLALSPDGNTLVIGDDAVDGSLWVQRRGQLEPVVIAGTERATNPAFSPDGEWVAFISGDGRLKKVRPFVGGVVTLVDSAGGYFGGPAWLDDNSIVYVSPSLAEIRRVSASGGAGTQVITASDLAGGVAPGQPTPLPGSRGLLFVACSSGCATQTIYVLDLRTGEKKPLVPNASRAWYLPTGHVIYARRDGTVLAAPFDLDRLDFTGEAVPVLDHVATFGGYAELAVSASGRLAYVHTTVAEAAQFTSVRVSRAGVVTPIDTAWYGGFNSLALSPDGRRVAIGAGQSAGNLAIWIKQLDRGPFTRLSFGGQDRRPVWSPDGKTVAFIRDTIGTSAVYARPVDGSQPDHLLARLDRMVQGVTWSPDGKWLVMRTDDVAPGAGDIVGVRLTGDTTPVPLVFTQFSEFQPSVSPDGRWLAYTSNESGATEVYVRPFPTAGGGRWQVSTQGGTAPRWSPDSRELFFVDRRNNLVAAQLGRTTDFEVTETRTLFSVADFFIDSYHQTYEVLPGNAGFMMLRNRDRERGGIPPRLVMAENWFADLKARLGK